MHPIVPNSYRFRQSSTMDPLDRVDRALWYNGALDLARLESACACFEGTHDFSSFANRLGHKSVVVDPVRTVRSVQLVEEVPGLDYRLDFVLDGALYKMVRNIVGMLFMVGSGQCEVGGVAEVMALRDRQLNHARAAPAEGLTLEHVFYDSF